jgi:hypothetical protein
MCGGGFTITKKMKDSLFTGTDNEAGTVEVAFSENSEYAKNNKLFKFRYEPARKVVCLRCYDFSDNFIRAMFNYLFRKYNLPFKMRFTYSADKVYLLDKNKKKYGITNGLVSGSIILGIEVFTKCEQLPYIGLYQI